MSDPIRIDFQDSPAIMDNFQHCVLGIGRWQSMYDSKREKDRLSRYALRNTCEECNLPVIGLYPAIVCNECIARTLSGNDA